jgi:antitoxin component YwqK of YwqJK toxin-antitoxin module
MSRTIIILSLFLLVSCSPKEIPVNNLVNRQGIFYEINSQTPFTGITLKYHENGQVWFRKTYKDGRLHGLYEAYFENGQLRGIRNYKNGRFHGLYEDYYENGQPARTTNFIGGLEQDGLRQTYYENGQIESIQHMKDGKTHGIREVYSNDGKLEFKQIWKNGRRDGLNLNYVFSTDGDPIKECYRNGNIVEMSYCDK